MVKLFKKSLMSDVFSRNMQQSGRLDKEAEFYELAEKMHKKGYSKDTEVTKLPAGPEKKRMMELIKELNLDY
jgi:hypothetical protein